MSGNLANASKVAVQVPRMDIPAVNPDGTFTPAWYYFMISMLARTGGQPGISIAQLQAEILALEALVATEQAMEDVPDLPNYAFPAMLAEAFAGDVAPRVLDPVLAGLLMSDAA
jgi:hypothetical protein